MELNRSDLHTQLYKEITQSYRHQTLPIWDFATKVIAAAARPLWAITSFYQNLQNPPKKNLPPSALGHTLLGSLPELSSYNWELFPFISAYCDAHSQEGICELQLGLKTFYIIADPLLAREILLKPKYFIRGESLRIWRKFSPGGLSEGGLSMNLRGKAQAAIGEEQLAHYYPSIARIADRWITRLIALSAEEKPLDLMKVCERATLGAIGETLFKRNPEDPTETNPFDLTKENDRLCEQFLDAFHTLFALITKRITSAIANIPAIGDTFYAYIHHSEESAFDGAKAILQKTLRSLYEKLLANPEEIDHNSHFYQLLQTFQIDIFNPDYDTILDESIGFLQASFETSSKALGWALHTLAQRPELQQELRCQLQDAYGNTIPSSHADFREKTPLLLQVIEETLRLFSPFPFLLRDITASDQFEKYEVKNNGTFVISPFFIHRQEKYWPNAKAFCPERFTEEMLSDGWQRSHPEYAPFIAGIHRCPGRFFAKQELCAMLARLLLTFEIIGECDAPPPELELCITLQPKNPIKASFKLLNR